MLKLKDTEQSSSMSEELAIRIADRYISIQECEDGYDYTIYGVDYCEIDGGVYDNPEISIKGALEDILEDLKTSPDYDRAKGSITMADEPVYVDYEDLLKCTEEAERIQTSSNRTRKQILE